LIFDVLLPDSSAAAASEFSLAFRRRGKPWETQASRQQRLKSIVADAMRMTSTHLPWVETYG
jgi:hypothetical protein